MKIKLINAVFTVLILACTVAFTGCKTTVTKRTKSATTTSKALPPGQAKKLNGDKSAKKYAPGQQKKKGLTVKGV